MSEAAAGAWIAAGASFIIACLSGSVALVNRSKTDANSVEIQTLKSAVDRDLERLKAKLFHGQVVSSTQWNAEFSSYQAIWTGMVSVRTLTTKILFREKELIRLGLPDEYLDSADRVENRKSLLLKLGEAAQRLLVAIHDNAPFYPAPIRQAANDTHAAALRLIEQQMIVVIQAAKGFSLPESEQFVLETEAQLRAIIEGVDLVESLIRNRLAAVEVVNAAV